jgi:hypothetical protein
MFSRLVRPAGSTTYPSRPPSPAIVPPRRDHEKGAHAAESPRHPFSIGEIPLHAHGATVQPKLEVGAANDPLEAEADRIAERVMGAPRAGDRSSTPASAAPADTIQRKCAACEEEWTAHRKENAASSHVAAVSMDRPAALGTGGQPLDAETRAFMEPRFGHDFRNVRIHADGQAVESAEQIGARAFTVSSERSRGGDIYFGAGEYRPSSHEGRRLLAHELAHVVQQGAGRGAGLVQRDPKEKPKAPPVTTVEINQVAGGIGGEAVVKTDGKVVRKMKITTGRPTHPTPSGDYTTGKVDPKHQSSTYGKCVGKNGSHDGTSGSCGKGETFQGAAMTNYTVFQGHPFGFHEGSLTAASHGCVHLSAADAAWVGQHLPEGTKVHVNAAPHPHAAHPHPAHPPHPGRHGGHGDGH